MTKRMVTDDATRLRAGMIVESVAAKHGIPVYRLYGRSREAEVVAPRFEAWARLKDDLGLSTTEIGGLFDRDHSSILHGLARYKGKAS